jgi:phosphatidylserine/phosphatidylglycerophosphate/cardiolipin synthase-like enzyme
MGTNPKLKAYRGDAKTLLAWDLPKAASKNLAGFSIQCEPSGREPYYLLNTLRFAKPGDHAQDPSEPAHSSLNAPFHKFRWLHVPGSAHQGTKPFIGKYTYTITPRYFDDNGSLEPLDPSLSASVVVEVGPLAKKKLTLGFTRGFTQSQAFVHHFGRKALIRPKGRDLIFDTSQVSGKNAKGETYTFADEYEWLGATARARIMELLQEVADDRSLHLDVFAYDLNEPDVVKAFLALAKQGRIRMILDNASLHKTTKKRPSAEDEFEEAFDHVKKGKASILRGKFGRYSHDKIFVVSRGKKALKVLTGSTNFSVTGLNVNSNHVVLFDDPTVAAEYFELFETAFQGGAKVKPFLASELSSKTFSWSSAKTPKTDVTFSPHEEDFAKEVLDGIAARIQAEGKKKDGGSVLFAVMQLNPGTGPVFPALQKLHSRQNVFSYGISDSPGGISLYKPGSRDGVLVTGKPMNTQLPAPFDQVRSLGGEHQIHHKFVVCGFNGDDPVVYCGSSNLALGGEQANGDNLLAIHDEDIATAFAIEAVALVDHFEFLDRFARKAKKAGITASKPPTDKSQAAADAGWFLSTNDGWTRPYYDRKDLHFVDRELFA